MWFSRKKKHSELDQEKICFSISEKSDELDQEKIKKLSEPISIENILHSLISRSNPEQVRIINIDGKDNLFDSLKNSPFIYTLPVDIPDNVNYTKVVVSHLEKEVKRRINLFKDREVTKLSEYNELLKKEGKPILPKILAITDGSPSVKAIKNTTSFQYLIRKGKSVEILTLWSKQPARKTPEISTLVLKFLSTHDQTPNLGDISLRKKPIFHYKK